MKNTLFTKKPKKSLNELTIEEKDKIILNNRRLLKYFTYGVITMVIIIFYMMYQSQVEDMKYRALKFQCSEDFKQILRDKNCSSESSEKSYDFLNTIVKSFDSIITKILETPYGFWTKFFIFLGIIYIVQVSFSLLFDVFEVFLMIGYGIIKLTKFTYKFIRNKIKQ